MSYPTNWDPFNILSANKIIIIIKITIIIIIIN